MIGVGGVASWGNGRFGEWGVFRGVGTAEEGTVTREQPRLGRLSRRIDEIRPIMRQQRANDSAKDCADAANDTRALFARDTDPNAVVVAASHTRADSGACAPTDRGADHGGLTAAPDALAVSLYLGDVLPFRGGRSDHDRVRSGCVERP